MSCTPSRENHDAYDGTMIEIPDGAGAAAVGVVAGGATLCEILVNPIANSEFSGVPFVRMTVSGSIRMFCLFSFYANESFERNIEFRCHFNKINNGKA